MSIDSYIRAEMQNLHLQTHVIEPSTGFTEKMVHQATLVEQQRRARINIWFAVTALTPYALRQLWSLIRSDFISLSSLPGGHYLVPAYQAFMSSLAIYALLGAGVLLAFFIVGLPRWRKSELHVAK